MKLSESLKSNRDFQNVYKNGKSFANKYLVMYVLKNEKNTLRLGISVSKKVGNSVVRHRVTRLIRESFRLNDYKFNSGLDIVVIARAGAKGRDYQEISSAVNHLSKLHKIVKEMNES
ncbi:ribonuclease P protein component [Anaerosporobacter faecicola]|uniref:ribonuclease P protein component n=1 Tax=Anaerosporobacter faecicola TaxID=2718714 RepID=UPI00143B5335|nr:ribonuclease P protein component [Anaerosporobacter faecicola]